MRLGAFTTFTPEYTFPEACRLLKEIGFEGVQPRIVADNSAGFNPDKPLNPWGNNKGSLKESDFFADPVGTLRPVQEAGLVVTSVASYAHTGEMPRAVAMAQACAKAGIKNVRIGGRSLPRQATYDLRRFLDESRQLYRELVDECRKVGVRPCLELHMGTAFPGPSGVMAFLQGFSPDEVGVLYDPGNMVAEGLEPVDLSLRILGPFLAEVHVKNGRWARTEKVDRGCRVYKYESAPLDDGVVNWAEVVEKLRAFGYQGWLIEEGHLQGVPSKDRLESAHRLLNTLLG